MSRPPIETALYDALDVSPSATTDEIKKAYRKLAMRHHPDKSTSSDSTDKFREIHHAYDILSDPNKREKYDRHGAKGLEEDHSNGDFGDIFGNFFGSKASRPERSGPQMHCECFISLTDIFLKRKKTITFDRRGVCASCNLTGTNDGSQPSPCAECRGSGAARFPGPSFFFGGHAACNKCGGTGKETIPVSRQCKDCNGEISKLETIIKEVEIPANVIPGGFTVFPGEGGYIDNKIPIDLVVRFIIAPSTKVDYPNYDYKNGLTYTEKLHLSEAICGFKRLIEHPSGKKILIVSDFGDIIAPEIEYYLPELGFDGDYMTLIFEIEYPTTHRTLKGKEDQVMSVENIGLFLDDNFGQRSVISEEPIPDYAFNMSEVPSSANESYSPERQEETTNGMQPQCVQQ